MIVTSLVRGLRSRRVAAALRTVNQTSIVDNGHAIPGVGMAARDAARAPWTTARE